MMTHQYTSSAFRFITPSLDPRLIPKHQLSPFPASIPPSTSHLNLPPCLPPQHQRSPFNKHLRSGSYERYAQSNSQLQSPFTATDTLSSKAYTMSSFTSNISAAWTFISKAHNTLHCSPTFNRKTTAMQNCLNCERNWNRISRSLKTSEKPGFIMEALLRRW